MGSFWQELVSYVLTGTKRCTKGRQLESGSLLDAKDGAAGEKSCTPLSGTKAFNKL